MAVEDRVPIADPSDAETFERSRLDLAERRTHATHYRLYRDLITLRRCDPVLSGGVAELDGAVLSDRAFCVRWFTTDGSDRLLIVNLGSDLALDILPEPLLAPPTEESEWRRLWSSEDACYGGVGYAPLPRDDGSWRIPAESATLLAAEG
jgi:maltooligosyltrehalose trehalohydrolase